MTRPGGRGDRKLRPEYEDRQALAERVPGPSSRLCIDIRLTHADCTMGQTGAWDRTSASLNLHELAIHDLHSCVYVQVLLGLEFEPKIRMDGEW